MSNNEDHGALPISKPGEDDNLSQSQKKTQSTSSTRNIDVSQTSSTAGPTLNVRNTNCKNSNKKLNKNNDANESSEILPDVILLPQHHGRTPTSGHKRNDETMLRVVARMFRQQADLFLKQAACLERMSYHLDDPSMWDLDGSQIPSREDLEDKIRREAVIDLAKKSYEGMKEVKVCMDSLLQNKRKSQHSKRRKFAFELFENEIMKKIIKEPEYVSLSRNHDDDDPNTGKLANYVFKRTQLEWKKLKKKDIEAYAKKAASNEGIKHLEGVKKPKKKRKKVETMPRFFEPPTKKNKSPKQKSKTTHHEEDFSDSNEKLPSQIVEKPPEKTHVESTTQSKKESKTTEEKHESNHQKGKDISGKMEEKHSDQSSDDDDSSSRSSIGSDDSISKTKQRSSKSVDDESSEGGFDLSAMGPISIPIISTISTKPMRRERDESSSSEED